MVVRSLWAADRSDWFEVWLALWLLLWLEDWDWVCGRCEILWPAVGSVVVAVLME